MSQAGEAFGIMAAVAEAAPGSSSSPALHSAGNGVLQSSPSRGGSSGGGAPRPPRPSETEAGSRLSRPQMEVDLDPGFGTPKRGSRAGSNDGLFVEEIKTVATIESHLSRAGSHIDSRPLSKAGSFAAGDVPTALGGILRSSVRPREAEHIVYDPSQDSPDTSFLKGTPTKGTPTKATPQGTPQRQTVGSPVQQYLTDMYNTAGLTPPKKKGETLLTVREATDMVQGFKCGIQMAGWLYKLAGKLPQEIAWKKYWFYIAEDRLYFTADAKRERAIGKTHYIALDRVPVRPLPHRRRRVDASTMTTPDVGISMVDTRVMAHLGVKLKPSTCFGIVSGAHTYYLAADTPEEARAWIKALRQTWTHCYTHTLRGTESASGGHHDTSRLLAVNHGLCKTVRDLEGRVSGQESEYWRNWLEERMHNRLLEDKLQNTATYEIEVKTGRLKGSCSDARIYIELFGPYENVSTGEIRLINIDSHQRPFTRDALDLFIVTTKNVGLPNHIKVWHDNSGRYPDWFLDYVRIRKTKILPDGSTARQPGHPATQRRLSMSAGNSPVHGGPKGGTSEPGGNSPAHGGPKGGTSGPGGGPWVVFPCMRWFSTQLDDCRISRLMFAGHSSPLIQYKVEILTSDTRGAGSDANVHLIMHGTLGDSQRHILSSGHDDFERGMVNEFVIDDEELGELLEATVGHDNTGGRASWHMEHMIITNLKTGQRFIFPCRQWFDTRIGDGLTERVIPVGDELGHMSWYSFATTTSELRGAGTDADVYVALHGDLGDTPSTILPSRPEHFERGTTDTFRLQLPNVGKIRTLSIGHNNMGSGPAWHLEMVVVVDEEAERPYYFTCGKWLGLGVEDNLLERTLVASDIDPRGQYAQYTFGFHTSTQRGAGTDANVYFQLLGEKADSSVQRLVAPKEAFERGTVDTFSFKIKYMGKLKKLLVQHDNTGANPAWHLLKVVVSCPLDKHDTVFVCNDWIRSDDPAILPAVELMPGLPLPSFLRYKVEVTTGNVRGAGTDSSVFIEMYGMQGKLGPLQLDTATAFERGQKDTFLLEGSDLGALSKIIVSVDPGSGKNVRPMWNMDNIMIYRDESMTDPETAVFFPLQQWFSKEQGMVKEIFPMRLDQMKHKMPYVVKVFTSSMKGAGTDCNVDINVIGSSGETGFNRLIANYDTFERGQEDTFTLLMHDVGRPAYLVVRSDGSSTKPSWHLDMVVLESDRFTPAFFLANTWLGPETALDIRMPASWVDPRGDMGVYIVSAFTSDLKNAGTDAGIIIEILGDRATSGKKPLIDMVKDTFERGQQDDFRVECRTLGILRAIRIESDARSTKPSWHMDMVSILCPSGEVYFFPYHNWIAEGKLKVEIPASLLDPTQGRKSYKVVTLTSNIRGAGTDANVYIDIRGTRASTGRIMLKNASTDPFERAQADEFDVKTGDLGGLVEILIGHDNTGQGSNWHLEQVDITDTKTGQTWFFECNNWLSAEEGDRKLERILPASLQNPKTQRNAYYIVVKTARDIQGAGTDAKVFVDIMGENGNTGKSFLRNANLDNFEPGQVDEFNINSKNLGPIHQMLLGHDNSGYNPSWHPQVVSVTDLTTKQTYWFDAKMWFDTKQGDGRIERILPALLQEPVEVAKRRDASYEIVVQTSKKRGAGTDANVFIILYGEDGAKTDKINLNNPGNDFESGSRDVFQVNAPEMDTLAKIRIGHDNSGIGAAWHLDHVTVTNKNNGAHYMFPCNKWFAKDEDDFQIERDLYPSGTVVPESVYDIEVLTSNISGAGTDANVFILLYGEGGEAGPLLLDNPKNNFEAGDIDKFSLSAVDVGELRSLKVWHDNKGFGASWHLDTITIVSSTTGKKYYFYCGQWLDKDHGVERTLPASLTDPRDSLTTYAITVHTSDIAGAGTDAKVLCNLFGERADSGARELTAGGNLFEQGKADMFKFKMVDLGELVELEIWHDNGGFGAAWHLDYVEVLCSSNKKVTYFPCDKWFDKSQGDKLIRRMLKPTYKDPRSFKSEYRVSVFTGDVSGAGTDANVYVNIIGDEGETGNTTLVTSGKGNCFERNKMDVFEFSSRNVGHMQKLRIGHDNAGIGAAWHLSRVVVENLTSGQSATFECNKWFAKNKDDGLIERELVSALADFKGPTTNWKLTIVTGTDFGAGTDADVVVEIHGELCNFGPHLLAAQLGQFEDGMQDQFSLTTPVLGVGEGAVKELVLGHNNKGMGAAWQLSTADLENMTTGEKWYFDFNNVWLDNKKGLSATRTPFRYKPPVGLAEGTLCAYRVELTTGPNEDSHMEKGQVFVNAMGHKGETGRQSLELPPQTGFQPSRIEAYLLEALPDTGSLRQLEIGQTSTEPWFVQEVLILNETSGVQGLFEVNRLLHPNEYVVIDVKELDAVDYQIEVKTTDRFNAGTTARVSISVYGDLGSTGRVPLDKEGVDTGGKGTLPKMCVDKCSTGTASFSRNGVDTFLLRKMADVGRMKEIEIGHDNTGIAPGWHLEYVKVTNMGTGRIALFPCKQWLAKNEADKKTTRMLDMEEETPPTMGPTATAVVTIGQQGGSTPFTSTLLRKMGGTVGQPGYRVTFNTSNIALAGTSAPVFFELIGENGSSGTILARATQSQFSRGATDTYVYPRLPFLGELLQMRVGTTGEGMFATWHLRTVEIIHVSSNERWLFACHNWIDKKCGWVRVLGGVKG